MARHTRKSTRHHRPKNRCSGYSSTGSWLSRQPSWGRQLRSLWAIPGIRLAGTQVFGTVLVVLLLVAVSSRDRWLTNLPTVRAADTGMPIQQLYTTVPNIQQCQPGSLQPAEREKVVQRLNEIRRRHQLSPVRYEAIAEPGTTQAALARAANPNQETSAIATGQCSSATPGQPSPNQMGYSVHYFSLGSYSPAFDLVSSESLVAALLQDSRRGQLSARRLLLDPYLSAIAFARVDGPSPGNRVQIPDKNGQLQETVQDYITAAALTVVPAPTQPTGDRPPHLVAYPFGDYELALFQKDEYRHGYPLMSLSIVADPNNSQNNTAQQVDLAIAQILIQDPQGKTVPVTELQANYQRYGLANFLSWSADAIQPGVKYTVAVKNVRLNGNYVNYDYWFRLK